MAWNLGALNSRRYATPNSCSLEIRTDARGLLYLAVCFLFVPLSFSFLLSLIVSGRLSYKANVSSETESNEEIVFFPHLRVKEGAK